MGRRQPFHFLPLLVGESAPNHLAEVNFLQFPCCCRLSDEERSPLRSAPADRLRVYGRKRQFRMTGGNESNPPLQIVHLIREIQHRCSVFYDCLADNLLHISLRLVGQRFCVQQDGADAPLPPGHHRPLFAVPKDVVALHCEILQISRVDYTRQEDFSHAPHFPVHCRDGKPLSARQGIRRLHCHQFASRQLEHANALFPFLPDAFRIGRGQQCPHHIRVDGCVVHLSMEHIRILTGCSRHAPPRATLTVTTLPPERIQSAVHGHIVLSRHRILLLYQRRDIGRQRPPLIRVGREQHACDTRMARQFGEPSSPRRHPSFTIQCAERYKQPARIGHIRLSRRCQPRQVLHIMLAPDGRIEHQRGQVGLQYLRCAHRRHARLRGHRPQAVAPPRRHTPRPSGALRRHIERDAHRLEVVQAAARVEHHFPAKAAVDHHTHPLDGQGSLGDRRRQHHLPFARQCRCDGLCLFVVR